MKLELTDPTMEPVDPAKDIRVFVACEDWAVARQARAVLEHIGSGCPNEGRLIYNCWPFDVLSLNPLRALAAGEAQETDMIVFAARDGSPLPEPVLDWISGWLALGGYQCRALVAILTSDAGDHGAPKGMLAQLKKVAQIGEMDFFATSAKSDFGRSRILRFPGRWNLQPEQLQ
jgi:hypothetical protein